MDPSQKAPKPLTAVNPGDLLRHVAQGEGDPAESPEALENRSRAGAEISMIFELNDSTAFKWFMREFIEKPYQEAFDKLRDPKLRDSQETLENIQQRYVALKAVRVGMLEREIAHREQIDPEDAQIKRLRDELMRL